MQNNNQNNKKAKGYYILLAALALVIGVSGYFFFSDAAQEQEEVEAAMSVPVQEQTDAAPGTSQQDKPETEKQQDTTPKTVERTMMPVSGDMVQDYAMEQLTYNTTTRDWRTHGGVDLAAELGQQVRAARTGTVMAVYEDEYYGMTVSLQHDDGYATMYCGLAEEIPVAAGQTVQAGDVIGTVGGTAMIETALQSHLHFEVSHNGEPVDPAGFLYN